MFYLFVLLYALWDFSIIYLLLPSSSMYVQTLVLSTITESIYIFLGFYVA